MFAEMVKVKEGWQKRLQHDFLFFGIWGAIGIAYLLIVKFLGFGLPCFFRLITGFQCPGCGITHLIFAALAGDWQGAWEANQALCVLLPIIGIICIRDEITFVLQGERKELNGAFLWLLVAILVVFGIWRNIY